MKQKSKTFPSSQSVQWSPLWLLGVLFISGGPPLSGQSQRHLANAQTEGGFPPCSICPTKTPMLGLPGLILPEGTVGITAEGTTCGEFEADAQAGTYSPAVCAIIRLTVSGTCGCIIAPPSAPAGPAPLTPTTAPVSGPTAAPVTTPTVAPVPAPTAAPVATSMPTTAPATAAPTTAPIAVTTVPAAAAPSAAPVTVAPSMAPVTIAPAMAPATVAPAVAPVTSAPTTAPANITVPVSISPTTAPAAVVVIMPTAAPLVNGTNVTTTSPTVTAGNATTTPPAPLPTAPVVIPTAAPVPAPLAPLGADIVVNMAVPGQLVGNDTVAFNKGCTTFLAEQLADDLDNVTCTFVNQSSSLAEPLRDEIVARVTGAPSNGSDDIATTAALQDAAVSAINESPGGFVEDVQAASDTAFFTNLTSTSVSAKAVAAPVPAPTVTKADDDDDGGLSSGGIAGIVIAAVVGVTLIGMIVLRLTGDKDDDGDDNDKDRQPYAEVEEHGEEENIMVYPPADPLVFPPDAPRAGVASRHAVQAAASGAGSVLSVSSAAQEETAESEMEGYSVKAGGSTTVDPQGSNADVVSAASGALSSLRHNMIARTVMIPAGKLGIVVDTTLEGPVVNRVNEGSPVEGVLFPGDIIVAVDDVDTRAMSASAIYSLMKKTSDVRRVITVLSEDVSA